MLIRYLQSLTLTEGEIIIIITALELFDFEMVG